MIERTNRERKRTSKAIKGELAGDKRSLEDDLGENYERAPRRGMDSEVNTPPSKRFQKRGRREALKKTQRRYRIRTYGRREKNMEGKEREEKRTVYKEKDGLEMSGRST